MHRILGRQGYTGFLGGKGAQDIREKRVHKYCGGKVVQVLGRPGYTGFLGGKGAQDVTGNICCAF